jgi:hypothetical protein
VRARVCVYVRMCVVVEVPSALVRGMLQVREREMRGGGRPCLQRCCLANDLGLLAALSFVCVCVRARANVRACVRACA